MAVAENLRESGGRVILEVLPSLHDAATVGIGKDGVTGLHDLHPFRFRAKDDARLLEEVGLFLHAARVGHDELGMTLQGNHLKEGDRRDKLDVGAAENQSLLFVAQIGLQQLGRSGMQRQYDLILF